MDQIEDEAQKILEMYPIECQTINSNLNSEWQFGFNSGMLAAIRTIQDHLSIRSNEPIRVSQVQLPYARAKGQGRFSAGF